ncbi:MAG: zinc-ribbon domain-containing protein [Deltaproteobacteria bacterium]|nr:zinc-ribbon domain-containing protein [Deltaproteobacteria bacterium]
MIAVCPKCSARYRVDTERVGPEGAKLRCTKCSALFLVRLPGAAASTPGVAVAPGVARPASTSASTSASTTGPAPVEAGSRREGERLVLVADSNEARGKLSVEAIRGFGLGAELVHDGVEAMLAIQRMLPEAVVLDVGLPRMYGFQICEVVKRNESLRATTVVLVGSVHDPSRYRREPAELYGADVYLEPADLPDGLHTILRERGLLVGGESAMRGPVRQDAPVVERPIAAPPRPTPPIPSAPPIPAPIAPSSAPTSSAASQASGDPARAEERERARRLARIAVSEMLLYQPEKFAQACREGTLERVLEMEIQEARALIRQRIGPEVRAEADFVLEELQRVARERGAKA